MVAWMTCSASMWLSRSLFSFIYEVIFILRDKECPQHVCIAPHIIHSSIRPMKQTSNWLIIRLSGQSGCGRQKRSCKEILFFFLSLFSVFHIFWIKQSNVVILSIPLLPCLSHLPSWSKSRAAVDGTGVCGRPRHPSHWKPPSQPHPIYEELLQKILKIYYLFTRKTDITKSLNTGRNLETLPPNQQYMNI